MYSKMMFTYASIEICLNVICKLLMDLTKLYTIILQSTIVIFLTKHIIKYI